MERNPCWLRHAALSLLATAAVAQSQLTTIFTSNNGGNVGGAVHFDLTVLHPVGIVLQRFDVNCNNPASTNAWLDVYLTNVGGTYVGNQQNPSAGVWSLRATAPLVTAGLDGASAAWLNNPIPLAPGTYGVTLVHRGCAARYTGTATVPPPQTVFATGDLRLDFGSAQNVPFSSATNQPRVANLTAYYAALTADTCAFSADVTRGASPLVVTFTDRSVLPAGTVSAWDWDFDGDNVTDSTAQNPVHVYGACGDQPVRLRITTPAGQFTTTWSQHIAVDPLVASFTATPEVGAPGMLVQFTDTSTLAPLTRAWDFDGDGLVDSTAANPTHTFGPGCHRVTLTVTNGCRTAQVHKRITAVTNTFATGGAGNSFVNRTSVVFFDLAVTSADTLSICGIDFNSLTPAGNPMDVDVYLTESTYLGKLTSPALWRKVASATGTTPGGNVPARLVLDRPILLLPGRSYGVGLHHTNNATYYINLTAPIANAELTLTPGAVAYSPAGPFTNATPFSVRQWIGSLHYLLRSQWPQGVTTWFASGCAGTNGVPGMRPMGTERPRIGTTTNFVVDGMPQNVGFVLLGFSNTVGPVGPLPQDLGLFGAPGCNLLVSPDVSSLLLGAGGTATWPFTLPNDPGLAGLLFFAQSLVLSPGSNALGGVTSDALGVMVGSF